MACNGMNSPFFPPNFMYQMQASMEESHHLAAMPQDLTGIAGLLGKRPLPMSFDEMGVAEDELSDDGSQAGEKKRRLNLEQVRTLEKNFELGNKLEPERKMQLARALGLQPRQIAIWFQNRRARWKTKKLEKDYEALRREFDAVKAENDCLHEHNKKLQAELMVFRGCREMPEPINLNKETEGSSSNRSENSSGINLDMSRSQAIDSPAVPPPPQPDPNQAIAFFPSFKQQAMNQLLQQCSTKAADQPGTAAARPDDNLCSIFGGIDDQSAFWAWSEQQTFH